MYDFTFCTPTKVCFGQDAAQTAAANLKVYGATRVLLHYGKNSAKASGLVDKIRSAIEGEGIAVTELGGVSPNPRLSLVYEGIELCKREKIDYILAVGGGSVIDSAKAIGMGTACGGDVWDFYCKKREPSATLPVGVVLTVAAAGSETSNSSVITNDKLNVKRGVNAELSRPVFSVLDPSLTLTVPEYPTACGCADIFMHTAERYLCSGKTLKLTDSLAEALMTAVIASSKAVMADLHSVEARSNLMWAGSLSHNGMTGLGSEGGDWCTHQLGHELSAKYDIAHGASLTAVWGSWARYVYNDCINRFHSFAVQVMKVRPNGTRGELALKGIEAAEEWFASLKLPTSIRELGVNPTDEELRQMAHSCAVNSGGGKGSCKYLKEDDMYAVYRAAMGTR